MYEVGDYVPASQTSKIWQEKGKDLEEMIRKTLTQNLSLYCLISSLNCWAVCRCHFRMPCYRPLLSFPTENLSVR